jgi:hypothetical protein
LIPAGISSQTFPIHDLLTPEHNRVDPQAEFPARVGPGFTASATYGSIRDSVDRSALWRRRAIHGSILEVTTAAGRY